jgi:putative membrane protein
VLVRELDVVPHARTQSLGLEQGPVQRRLGLATFALHSTQGPVSPSVRHLAGADAAALLHEQARRARTARADHTVEGDGRWMVR